MIGKIFLHYKILAKLGEGGMGVVYKARDTKLDREVAIKFLPQHISASQEERERFNIEAKAAASLNHPNIATIHNIEEADDETFIVMELVKGRELKEEIDAGPLPIEEAIRLAIQMAKGLQVAHNNDIIHRDIKSANIMLTDEGDVKIMDFGLAKIRGSALVTKAGTTIGTTAYMSPEQARGEDIDHRADLWSMGVVLYEMLTGQLPFGGDYEQAVVYSMLNEDPKLPQSIREDIPEALQAIVLSALKKVPDERLSSAEEFRLQLEEVQWDGKRAATRGLDFSSVSHLLKRPPVVIGMVAVLVLIAIAVYLPYRNLLKVQEAQERLPQIETLSMAGETFAAYQMAVASEKVLGQDSTLAALMPVLSYNLTVRTEPPGAQVYLKRFSGDTGAAEAPEEYIGFTPTSGTRLPRVDHKIIISKEGYAPFERIVSNPLLPGEPAYQVELGIDIKLSPVTDTPEDMAFVPGGQYHLVSWQSPTAKEAFLDDFYIDKYEVSNRKYKAFIEAGGYTKERYWRHPFIKDGVEMSFSEAMRLLVDRTGLPGPREWRNQEYPPGSDNHPVTGVTWYEAAAYASFVEKRLPTIYQWEKAARDGAWNPHGVVLPWGPLNAQEEISARANFEGLGLVEVSQYEFGISPFSCYNMAGNVKEWCSNLTNRGYVTTGGSWQDPVYMFAYYGFHPGFHASETLGFRCVRLASDASGDQGGFVLDLDNRTPIYTPVTRETFAGYLSLYKYDQTPPNAKVLETMETPHWQRLKVSFAGVYDDPIQAYLYLPKQAKKPFQCISFVPHFGVFLGMDVAATTEYLLAPHIKAGRAVLIVIPKGAEGRNWEPGYVSPEPTSVRYREYLVNAVTEFRIGLDYLETRGDIDMDKLAYVGVSWGAAGASMVAAVENRYGTVVFVGGGVVRSFEDRLPEVNPINFLPYIEPPKLLLNGKYDEDYPFETHAKPLFELLAEPKMLALVEGGHVPLLDVRVPIINDWLDETLGLVEFE